MRKIFYTFLILVVALIGLVLWLKNPQLVELNFYPDLRWEKPLSIIVATAFGCGILAGWLFSLVGRLKTGLRLSQAKREGQRAKHEIEKLKHGPVPDTSRQIAA